MIPTVGSNGDPNWLSSKELALDPVNGSDTEEVGEEVRKHPLAGTLSIQQEVERNGSKSKWKDPSIGTGLGSALDDNFAAVVVVAFVVAGCTMDVDEYRTVAEELNVALEQKNSAE